MKKILFAVLAVVIVLLMVFTIKNMGGGKEPTDNKINTESSIQPVTKQDLIETEAAETESETLGKTYANLSVAGDIVAHMPLINNCYNSSTGRYEFTNLFADIKETVEGADYAICDFESTFHGDGEYSGYPCFDSPDEFAEGIKNAGFDMVVTANNHSLDTWFDGLVRTLDIFDQQGLDHIGTYRTKEERDANQGVVLKDINGIKIAFIDYAYGTNGIPFPEGKEWCVNVFNYDYLTNLSEFKYAEVDADIDYAKSLDPDFIAFIIHWGNEYETHSNAYQEQIADHLFSKGVDLILGGHVHVPQNMEFRDVVQEDGTTKRCYVAYCLGNLVSNQPYDYTDLTAILDIKLSKDLDNGATNIESITYTPFMMIRATYLPYYRAINIHKAMSEYEAGTSSYVTQDLYNQLQNALNNIHNIMGETFDEIF